MNRGKIIILLILSVAVGVSVYGVWFRHRQMSRVLESYSAPIAQLIAYAPEAELLQLGSPEEPTNGVAESSSAATVKIGEQIYPVTAKKPVSTVRGFSKLRADLVRDSNYTWEEPAGVAFEKIATRWQFVLVLTDGPEKTRLAFSPSSGQLMLLDSGPTLSIAPISEFTNELLAEQFPAKAP